MFVQQQYVTVDRFLEMVEQPQYQDRVLELVEGAIVEMSKPTRIHGVVTMRLALKIANFVEERKLGEVTVGDTGFVLKRHAHERDTVRGLDIAFVNSDRLPSPPDNTWYEIGPDLAVEVISPNNKTADTHLKVTQLLNAGTRLIWVVYPENRSVVTHTANRAKTLYEDDTLSGGDVLPGFELRVGDIFPS
ncbi:MAG: Uma2 family endonuclease [Chloroflexi bacterium]|nr:Uma2 family endonuclease [Chloroflexota bacterium]